MWPLGAGSCVPPFRSCPHPLHHASVGHSALLLLLYVHLLSAPYVQVKACSHSRSRSRNSSRRSRLPSMPRSCGADASGRRYHTLLLRHGRQVPRTCVALPYLTMTPWSTGVEEARVWPYHTLLRRHVRQVWKKHVCKDCFGRRDQVTEPSTTRPIITRWFPVQIA